MTSTRAAISDGNGGFTIESIEIGLPAAGEVAVEIKAAGLCHTDHASLRWKRPLVMGHEGAGVVQAVGEGVVSVRPGDRVVLNWAIPCGHCPACGRGDEVLCETSRPAHVMERSAGHAHPEGTRWRGVPIDRSFNLGTFSGVALVRQEAVTPLPEGIPWASACIVGCGVMTGFGSAVNVARVRPGQTVVVIGCGGVGLNVIQGARLCGAARIVAVDTVAGALERAREFGATDVLQARRDDAGLDDAARRVRLLLGGRGADHAFEATAVPSLAFAPLGMIRDGGMAFQVSGINDPVTVEMPRFMWNKSYVTPLYGGCRPARDFPRIFSHYLAGELLLDELVTRTYPLDALGEALGDLMAGRIAKGVLLP
jgi:Zn-dependent alcohol dehydrogenase